MKATALLSATAICLAIACTKSEQASSDSLAVAAQNQATTDSISAAEQANAATTPATDTTAAAAAPAPAAPAPKAKSTTTAGAQKAATTAAPKPSAAVKTTTPAPVPPAPAKTEVKPAPAAAPAPAPAPPSAPPAATASAEGKELYDADCRRCHGVRGVPPKAMQTKFPKIDTFDAAFFAKRSQDSIVTILRNGKGQDMKSFRDKLTSEQMRAVAAYMRTFM